MFNLQQLSIARARRWFTSLFNRRQADLDLQNELNFHLAMESAALEQRGLPHNAAEQKALQRFGSVDRYAEDCRDERGTRLIETTVADVRYALRTARRFPAFTAAVVITLGLSIGVNSAMFTIINATLFQRLPFVRANEIVSLTAQTPDRSEPRFSVSYAELNDWRRETHSFTGMALLRSSTMTLAAVGEGEPERLSGLTVSSNFFQLLGVSAAAGRTYTAADDQGDANALVVLTHGFWKRRFGGDSTVIGRSVPFGGQSRTVIGVLPEDFTFDGRPIDAVTILDVSTIPGAERRNQRLLEAIGRLRTGVSLAQAQQDLTAVAAQLAQIHPESAGWGANVFGFRDELVRGTEKPLLVLSAAAALVLLIGCSNVAGLLIARGATRSREIGLRRALGASRQRLVGQLLIESGVLAGMGAVVGIAISLAATRLLLRIGPAGIIPPLESGGLGTRVLAFTLGLSFLTTVAVGLWPATLATTGGLSSSLRDGGRNSTGGSKTARLRQWLVISEISLALVLLMCTALVMQSIRHTLSVDPGFKAENVVTMRLTLGQAAYPDSAQNGFYREFLTRLNAQPGIDAAAAANTPPIAGGGIVTPIRPMGRVVTSNEKLMHAATGVTPDYFRTMGMHIVRGRDVRWSDASPTLLLSESSARQLWPGQDVIGKRIAFGTKDQVGLEIVGIVNDAHARGLREEPTPMIYLAYSGASSITRTMSIVVRGQGDAATLAATTRRVLRELDRSLPVYSVQSVQEVIDGTIAQPKLNASLLAVFAGMALLLAAIGIYGVVSYSVSQRSQELGVRIALGAAQSDVFRLILREGALLSVVGVLIGLVGAFAATPLIQTWLFGIGRGDPVTFAGAAVTLTIVALGASWLPARRATRVNPLLAMRGV